MSTVYCTAPWNGITVRENGDVKTCCSGIDVLGNLNEQNIEDILTSQKLQSIQSALAGGNNNISNCEFCVHHEKQTGLSSLRQHYLKFYPEIFDSVQIKNLDIRWNNSCNLGCMYCNGVFSSTWEDRLGVIPIRNTKNYQDQLEHFILERADQVQEIMLVGGEPMLMKQNAKLFARLPQSTQISIITNISYDIKKLPYIHDLLKRPKNNVIWNLSLENTGQQFEYVRNGADWNQVEENLLYLVEHWPETVSILMVYNVFSAFDLTTTMAKFRSIGIKKFVLQTYSGDPALDVFAMPASIQQIALKEIEAAMDHHNDEIHPEDRDLFPIANNGYIIHKLSNNLSTNQPITKKQFFEKIQWCDQWNQHSFQELWPNVVKLVDNHLE